MDRHCYPEPHSPEEEYIYDVYWDFIDDTEYNFKVLYTRNKMHICGFFFQYRFLHARRLMYDRSGYIPYRRRKRM